MAQLQQSVRRRRAFFSNTLKRIITTIRSLLRLAVVGIALTTAALGARAASFYSLQLTNRPPLPFLPFDLPVYDLGGGLWAYDDLEVDYFGLRWLAQLELLDGPPPPEDGSGTGSGLVGTPAYNFSNNVLWVEMLAVSNRTVTLVIHAPDTNAHDLFRTFALTDHAVTNSEWRWVGRGTNAQRLSFPEVRCRQAFYLLASGMNTDTDGDQLSDAFETLVSKTSPATNRTFYSTGLDDKEWWLRSNILVNDPEQDCGNEQNSQFETTVAVVGTNVIVAWVDSNRGVYNLGGDVWLTNYTPRLVGYAVSRDGGVTFEDMDVPPLCTNNPSISSDDGDAGDPVLAVDGASGVVYLAGTSMRSDTGFKGIPFWKSTNGGVTFSPPMTVRDDITSSDKPWIGVDNATGTGQHDVYLACKGFIGTNNALWLTVSTDGSGINWSSPTALRQNNQDNVVGIQSAIPLVGPDHAMYAFWFERTSEGTNWLKMRQVLNRGATLGDVQTVRRLVSTNSVNGNLELKRSNTATNTDTFRVFCLPVPAVNPVKTNHLYVAYADKGTNANDRADIFWVGSTNGGTNWSSPLRVNSDSTINDQWMPVLCVKPDGTQLFMAWYDRRNDTNNSLIDVYGRFGTVATNGSVAFGSDFRITTTNFPPVFAGTDTNNIPDGHYDPVYPPTEVNLHWHYPEWPDDPEVVTDIAYRGHAGEYNGAWAEGAYVYMTWTDYRLPSAGTVYPRNQSDIRFIRLAWPD